MARTKVSARTASKAAKNVFDLFKSEQKSANPKMTVKAITESWEALPQEQKSEIEKRFENIRSELSVEEKGEVASGDAPMAGDEGKKAPIVEEPSEDIPVEEEKPAPVSSSSTPAATPPDAIAVDEKAVVSPSEVDNAPDNILVPGSTAEPKKTNKRGRKPKNGNGESEVVSPKKKSAGAASSSNGNGNGDVTMQEFITGKSSQ